MRSTRIAGTDVWRPRSSAHTRRGDRAARWRSAKAPTPVQLRLAPHDRFRSVRLAARPTDPQSVYAGSNPAQSANGDVSELARGRVGSAVSGHTSVGSSPTIPACGTASRRGDGTGLEHRRAPCLGGSTPPRSAIGKDKPMGDGTPFEAERAMSLGSSTLPPSANSVRSSAGRAAAF